MADYSRVGEYSILDVKRFSATIYYLVKEEGYRFDLLAGAGNSGSQLTKFAELVFEELGAKAPIVTIPSYRFIPTKDNPKPYDEDKSAGRFDNSILLGLVKKQLKGVKSVKNVLFVDDEIGEGISAKTILDLLLNFVKNSFNYFIVAEDVGFSKMGDWVKSYPSVSVRFCPFSNEWGEGYFNIISYHVPYKISEEIKKVIPDNDTRLHASFLLSAPVKEFNNGVPIFTDKYETLLKSKIKGFSKLQKEYKDYLKELIKTGIKEYKEGKLKPYFLEKGLK